MYTTGIFFLVVFLGVAQGYYPPPKFIKVPYYKKVFHPYPVFKKVPYIKKVHVPVFKKQYVPIVKKVEVKVPHPYPVFVDREVHVPIVVEKEVPVEVPVKGHGKGVVDHGFRGLDISANFNDADTVHVTNLVGAGPTNSGSGKNDIIGANTPLDANLDIALVATDADHIQIDNTFAHGAADFNNVNAGHNGMDLGLNGVDAGTHF